MVTPLANDDAIYSIPKQEKNNNSENSSCEPSVEQPSKSQQPLPPSTEVVSPIIPYTTFTRTQLHLLTLLLGLTTITSPLTATIYFPLLPLLRTHFHVSAQAINLTITIYIIFQALSPALFGPLSDSLGRRPVYLLTLSIYAIANLGLAVLSDRGEDGSGNGYVALLALRALQSVGASAAFAVSYGVVADVCVPSERGSMLGPVSMALNLGACVGPVVGGWVAFASGEFEWVFWALVVVGAVLLVGVVGFLPETARSVVGNGEGRRALNWWEESVWGLVFRRGWSRSRGKSNTQEPEVQKGEDIIPARCGPRRRFHIQNPLACLLIIFHYDTFLSLWMHGSFYTVDYCMVTAIPDIYTEIYHFNSLQIGLSYLPRGAGIIIGGYCNGKLMDHNYRVVAKRVGWMIDRVAGDDLKSFPIERARSRGSYWLLVVSTATLVGYGWAVARHSHVSVLLILQFVQGFWGTCFYTVYNTLLVDVYPESPSTAAAAASITRCAMAAAGIAVLQPLLDALGRGWYFTILGIWSGGFGALAVYLIHRKGLEWRTRRLGKKSETSVNNGLRQLNASRDELAKTTV